MILKINFSKFLIIFLSLILLIHGIATYFFLYWRIWWLDCPLHFLGGAWLGFFTVWLLFFTRKISIKSSFLFILLFILGISALVGVLWEASEFFLDKFLGNVWYGHFMQIDIEDMMTDLFFDLIGGLFAGLIFYKNFYKKDNYGK